MGRKIIGYYYQRDGGEIVYSNSNDLDDNINYTLIDIVYENDKD